MQATLDELRRRFRDALDRLGDAIFRLDRERRCTFVNAAWAELTGRPPVDSIGRSMEAFIADEDRASAVELLDAVLRGGREFGLREVRILRADGSVCRVEMRLRASRDAAGNVVGASGTLRDLDADVRPAQGRGASIAPHGQNDAALAAAVADCGHGIRTPLNAILGYAEMIIDSANLDPATGEHAQTIRRNVEELIGVVDAMFGAQASSAPATVEPAPVAQPAVASSPASAPRAARLGGSRSNGRFSGHVLLAEDSRDNQKLVAYLLNRCGLDVTVADNGRIALELATLANAQGKPFDLILMDVQMPEMDGYDATRAIRAHGMRMPIVALTAHAMTGDRDRCIAAGCTDYLSKPLERARLTETLARYLPDSPADADAAGTATGAGANVGLSSAARPAGTRLVSRYSNQPDMRDIIAKFVAGLPATVARIHHVLATGEMDKLQQVLHELKGTGGGYGFDEITRLAGAAEASMRLGADAATIRAAVEQLVATLRRVDGYDTAINNDRAAA